VICVQFSLCFIAHRTSHCLGPFAVIWKNEGRNATGAPQKDWVALKPAKTFTLTLVPQLSSVGAAMLGPAVLPGPRWIFCRTLQQSRRRKHTLFSTNKAHHLQKECVRKQATEMDSHSHPFFNKRNDFSLLNTLNLMHRDAGFPLYPGGGWHCVILVTKEHTTSMEDRKQEGTSSSNRTEVFNQDVSGHNRKSNFK